MKKLIVILTLGCVSCGVNEGDIVTEVRSHNKETDVIFNEVNARAIVKHGTGNLNKNLNHAFCVVIT